MMQTFSERPLERDIIRWRDEGPGKGEGVGSGGGCYSDGPLFYGAKQHVGQQYITMTDRYI